MNGKISRRSRKKDKQSGNQVLLPKQIFADNQMQENDRNSSKVEESKLILTKELEGII
jgi:hypothetical protein